MISYKREPNSTLKVGHDVVISDFTGLEVNIDTDTVVSFGDEWNKFAHFSETEINNIGDEYFDIVDTSVLNKNSVVLDLGCGSGRWTKYVAPKVKFVEAVDPSNSIVSANELLYNEKNVRLTKAGVDTLPFENESFDFAFSLGVLHHIPDTRKALNDLVKAVKLNGHVLIYLYYSLDNRSGFYKLIFSLSNLIRKVISKMPKGIKHLVCDMLAIFVYYPFIFLSSLFKSITPNSDLYKKIPLSYYVGKTYNVVRNDALDRFGTPLEQRFSKEEIKNMMLQAGLSDIVFSDNFPYWHALGKRVK